MQHKPFIDEMAREDWAQVSKIYAEGIATDNATFQQEVPSWEAWDHSHAPECRIVARAEEKILG